MRLITKVVFIFCSISYILNTLCLLDYYLSNNSIMTSCIVLSKTYSNYEIFPYGSVRQFHIKVYLPSYEIINILCSDEPDIYDYGYDVPEKNLCPPLLAWYPASYKEINVNQNISCFYNQYYNIVSLRQYIPKNNIIYLHIFFEILYPIAVPILVLFHRKKRGMVKYS
jgi:hypothetical protein